MRESIINRKEINITKLYLNKVFGDEFKPIHTREMIVNASFANTNHLSEALYYKGGVMINENDLLAVPDLITLSDNPSHEAISVNGGWGVDRYSFLMEITIFDTDSVKNLYLSGYTDRDDLLSLKGTLNPDILLVFNDCLITQTLFNTSNGIPLTRIISNWDILPDPEDDYRETTLRPSDCFALMQGERELGIYSDEKDIDSGGITFSDTRLINKGGKVAAKLASSLDSHLVKVSNDYVQSSVTAIDNSNANEAISSAVWDSREQAAYSTIDLFNILWRETGAVVTNNVKLETLLNVAPLRFKDPSRDYVVREKDRYMSDVGISGIAQRDQAFRALTTTDSESTGQKTVEVKLAQMLLQELNVLMSVYKINKLAISATNYDKDYNNEPIVIISSPDSIIKNSDITKVLLDNFVIAFKNKIFNKISFNDQVAVNLVAYIGFNIEKVELSVNGNPPTIISLPTYMSNAFSHLVGTMDELKTLSTSYNNVFASLDSNIRDLRETNGGYGNSISSNKIIKERY